MNRLTLAKAKPIVARALGLCNDDPRVVDFINEAQERLLNRPTRAVGCDQLYCFTTESGCVTLPRQVRSIERWALCGIPGTVRPEWFDYGFNGYGEWSQCKPCDAITLKHMGTAATFNDPTSSGNYIRVTTDVTEDAETYLWIFGLDENGQPVRTQISGEWHDGERIDLADAPVVTTHQFVRITHTIKASTKGMVRLYEWDGAEVVQALAFYEPSEERPIYRRILIPGITDGITCCSCGSSGGGDASSGDFVECGPITESCLTMSTGFVLGRSTASNGAIEEIEIGDGLELVDGVLASTGAGTGDMLKATYDPGDNGIVDEATLAYSLTLTCPDDATTHAIRVRLVGSDYVLEIV